MKIKTGQYTIINAKNSRSLVLPDGGEGTSVVAGSEGNTGDKWNITLLHDGTYAIMNATYPSSVNCGISATAGAGLSGRSAAQQWIIKECATAGQYIISPSHAHHVYWGLANDELHKPVTLSNSPNESRNHWILRNQHPEPLVFVGKLDWYTYATNEIFLLVVHGDMHLGQDIRAYWQWTIDWEHVQKKNFSCRGKIDKFVPGKDSVEIAFFSDEYYSFNGRYHPKEGRMDLTMKNPRGNMKGMTLWLDH